MEILHTFLLGGDKYIWHSTTKDWTKESDIFAVRLQSSSIDGLSLPPVNARYLLQYKNSLIGKHFKAIQQLGIFHLYDGLCPENLFQLWRANGELGALLWYPEIDNMSTYLVYPIFLLYILLLTTPFQEDLDIAVANVLDLWAVYDPKKIIVKNKLHVLAHGRSHVQRHGPAVAFAVEVFECWNAIFRLCSIYSNRQAPSRDIALTTAGMERFKHIASGGYWMADNGEWICGGHYVRNFMKSNADLQRRLGWVDTEAIKPGEIFNPLMSYILTYVSIRDSKA